MRPLRQYCPTVQAPAVRHCPRRPSLLPLTSCCATSATQDKLSAVSAWSRSPTAACAAAARILFAQHPGPAPSAPTLINRARNGDPMRSRPPLRRLYSWSNPARPHLPPPPPHTMGALSRLVLGARALWLQVYCGYDFNFLAKLAPFIPVDRAVSILDAGTNVGLAAILFAQLIKFNGEVVAVDANPQTLQVRHAPRRPAAATATLHCRPPHHPPTQPVACISPPPRALSPRPAATLA